MVNSEFTITLPPNLYRRAQHIAFMTQRDLSEIVLSSLEHSLPTNHQLLTTLQPVSRLNDKHLMQLVDMRFSEEEDERLSELLARQREEKISTEEEQELSEIIQLYRLGMLRKSEALVEAVSRQLIPPIAQ